MGKDNILYLTTEDLLKLKKIGHGTEGSVYEYNKDLLIKIYHKSIQPTFKDAENDEDVKIYKRGHVEKTNYYDNDLNYYTYKNESIKLLPKEAIFKAIERQKDIELTTLPIGAVYLDGKFAGCVLVRHRGIQLHKLMGLPFNARKKLYLRVLKANAELLKHNIYHRDLSNSPYATKYVKLPDDSIISCGHSHILYNPLADQMNLIDLEGKSTVYTERLEDKYLAQNAADLNALALEFLFKTDYEEHKENLEELAEDIEKYHLSSTEMDKLLRLELLPDEMESVVKSL